MRMRIEGSRTALALMFAAGTAVAQTDALQPGLYEVELRTQFSDAQGESVVPVSVVRRCVSATEIQSPERLAPNFSAAAACVWSAHRPEPGGASWTVDCQGDPVMRGEAHVRWTKDRYAGETRMVLRRGAERMNMTQQYTAHRLGGC
ncbi:MAG TPA: DUF3617 family protein [Burkholderiales bacterium]|nr:DUF3617 family protein [Burkholderiales bacterium]